MRDKTKGKEFVAWLEQHMEECEGGVIYQVIAAKVDQLITEATLQWQPIDTAPKDGTLILATPCFDESKEPYQIHFDTSMGWGNWRFGSTAITAKPAHWMPLPQPPKENDNG